MSERKTIIIKDGTIKDGILQKTRKVREKKAGSGGTTKKQNISNTLLNEIRKRHLEQTAQLEILRKEKADSDERTKNGGGSSGGGVEQIIQSAVEIIAPELRKKNKDEQKEETDFTKSLDFMESFVAGLQEKSSGGGGGGTTQSLPPPPHHHHNSGHNSGHNSPQSHHHQHSRSLTNYPAVATAPKYQHFQPPQHPGWGCLKKGNYPTFRQFKNNTTLKNNARMQLPQQQFPSQQSPQHQQQILQNGFIGGGGVLQQQSPNQNNLLSFPLPPPQILHNSLGGVGGGVKHPSQRYTGLLEQSKLNQFVDKNLNFPPPQVKRQKKIVRRTFNVGKSKQKPQITVLLSNKSIRSKITTQKHTLKRTPMHQIKKKLIENGFIKTGSTAPDNILREIYENMFLIGGPVRNYNPDVLYYNLMHGKDAE